MGGLEPVEWMQKPWFYPTLCWLMASMLKQVRALLSELTLLARSALLSER